jgi:hypothetical protein
LVGSGRAAQRHGAEFSEAAENCVVNFLCADQLREF